MPKAFDKCYKNGGRITTMKLSGNRYRHVCTLKGKRYLGHVKTKKKKK